MRSALFLVLLMALGLTGWLAWMMVWWAAVYNGWGTVRVNFAGLEQWAEGVLIHLIAGALAVSVVMQFRTLRRRIPKKKSHDTVSTASARTSDARKSVLGGLKR